MSSLDYLPWEKFLYDAFDHRDNTKLLLLSPDARDALRATSNNLVERDRPGWEFFYSIPIDGIVVGPFGTEIPYIVNSDMGQSTNPFSALMVEVRAAFEGDVTKCLTTEALDTSD